MIAATLCQSVYALHKVMKHAAASNCALWMSDCKPSVSFQKFVRGEPKASQGWQSHQRSLKSTSIASARGSQENNSQIDSDMRFHFGQSPGPMEKAGNAVASEGLASPCVPLDHLQNLQMSMGTSGEHITGASSEDDAQHLHQDLKKIFLEKIKEGMAQLLADYTWPWYEQNVQLFRSLYNIHLVNDVALAKP